MGAACLLVLGTLQTLLAVPNPVIPRLADCGVMRYQGRYYISGYGMGGKMRVSDDLVHWREPVHVFSMHNGWTDATNNSDREIHAVDISYHQGLFHFYWSVNHFPLRQIGHAIAAGPTGPYHEPVTKRWFDGRIDPHLLVAQDGSCYFYTVKFTDGNVIDGQPMRDPWTLIGKPKRLLSALTGTWEQLDPEGIRVNEAPYVFYYRDRYYMLYNANHTAARYGNYGIGCAEARQPLGFSNAGKYDHPVLKTNHAGPQSGNEWAVATSPGKKPLLSAHVPDPRTRITNCGQASVVRGPNGFEWWIVYFAIYNGGPRSQAIDRLLFVDRHLQVDGPTDATTPGAHAVPALPTWRSLFEPREADWVNAGRQATNDSWRIEPGALQQTRADGGRRILLPCQLASQYLFEAGFRLPDGAATAQAGLLAARRDDQHHVRVGVFRGDNRWFYRIQDGEEITEEFFALPVQFDERVIHTWKILRNASSLRILLDGRPAPGKARVRLPWDGPAVPGLFTEQTQARFSALTYTMGWDEWDQGIDGWGPAAAGTPVSGKWQSGKQGLQVSAVALPAVTFKGDLLKQYDFQVQLAAAVHSGRLGSSSDRSQPGPLVQAGARIGCYPIYVDAQNYVLATIGLANGPLRIEAVVHGQSNMSKPIRLSLRPTYHLRAVKRDGHVWISIDGEQVSELPDVWPAAQVGLLAQKVEARFNDICRFHLPE